MFLGLGWRQVTSWNVSAERLRLVKCIHWILAPVACETVLTQLTWSRWFHNPDKPWKSGQNVLISNKTCYVCSQAMLWSSNYHGVANKHGSSRRMEALVFEQVTQRLAALLQCIARTSHAPELRGRAPALRERGEALCDLSNTRVSIGW